ncbi:MAG: dTDP-4-dehydrorhamnose reductase [Myxococcales bacterium]|nr:dTDP-4-dehydrorhamnose reductase [Myxococcales bacterium]
MKVLITGAAGQLGGAVDAACGARGLERVALSRPELDITDQARVEATIAAHAPGAVVNCAAYNDVDGSERDMGPAIAINALGPRNLAVACRRADIPLLHVSTDYVFDGQAERPYTIATPPVPLNRYGESKLLGERYVEQFSPRHFVVRVSWLFGGSGGKHCFVSKMLTWASTRETLRMVDDHVAAPTSVHDAAPMLLDLLEGEAYGTYHVTNQGACSRYEWAAEILEAAGLSDKVRLERARRAEFPGAARPAYSVLDTAPLSLRVGWREATRRVIASAASGASDPRGPGGAAG